MRSRNRLALAVAGALALLAGGCGGDDGGGGGGGQGGNLEGEIKIDGSSTVLPFAEAAVEMFNAQNPGVRITVARSGTGGGFERFCNGEIDISNASRPIKDDEEAPVCREKGVQYKQVQVANDGIAVATNRALQIKCMTTKQLKQLFGPDSKARAYNEIDGSFPSQPVSLFGADADSGTFDFFTEEINGEEGAIRKSDYQPSADDNVLVQGVAGEENATGYFGFSYFEQNQDKLGVVEVDAGNGCVRPTKQTIQSGDYKPLSRPIFMYPSQKALARPEVKAFMDFVVANQQQIAEAANIVPMTPQQADRSRQALG